MKKILLFAVLLSFTANTTLHAQLREEPYDLWDLLIGAKVGASASTLTKTGGDVKIWPTASIYTEVFVNQNLSMSFEASYSRKGVNNVIIDEWKVSEDVRDQYYLGPNHPYTYNLDYITTGYLVKYYLKQDVDVPVQLAFYSGLSFGTLVSAKAKIANTENVPLPGGDGEFVTNNNSNIKKHLRNGDFSIPVGVEVLLGRNFTIDGRWNWSPLKVASSSSEKGKILLGPARNQYFSLTLGYKILVF